MLIKFKAPDPRAGRVALMDSSRGHYFVASGMAEEVKQGLQPTPAPEQSAEKFVSGTASEVIASIDGVTDADTLRAALSAEKAGKDRKTVVDALEAAIAKG